MQVNGRLAAGLEKLLALPVVGPLLRVLLDKLAGFTLVAGVALGLDLGVIWLLSHMGMGLTAAAFGGYMCGNVLSYTLLCRFVYGVGIFSGRQYLRYLGGNVVGLLVRVGTVAGLVALGLHGLVVVGVAVGLSFVTNYLLTTLWAMRRRG